MNRGTFGRVSGHPREAIVAALLALAIGLTLLIALPNSSNGAGGLRLQSVVAHIVRQTAHKAKSTAQQQAAAANKKKKHAKPAHKLSSRAASPRAATPTPPLHGTNPHGQGTPASVAIAPSSARPYPSDPTGKTTGEAVVLGRARGEQTTDGYHGHITILALLGNEILGDDTTQGQTVHGPLNAIQVGVLDAICNGTNKLACLSAVTADSTTTSTGSTNHFSTAHATIAGPAGIDVGAAESNGNISSDGTCQNSSGDSQVANATLSSGQVIGAARSTESSSACRGQAPRQDAASSVISLGGTGVGIPAPGCANGTPNTTGGLPPLVGLYCNLDSITQAAAPTGVREALTVLALQTGISGLLQASTAQAESHAVAPPSSGGGGGNNNGGGGNNNGGGGGNGGNGGNGGTGVPPKGTCSDGKDNNGNGLVDASDPACHTDGNAGNPGSYNPSGNEYGTCADGRDNNNNGLIDIADPACHSDGNAHNPASYNPFANENGVGGFGGGAHTCSDGVDNNGNGLVDKADPVCHTDHNANNAASYNPNGNEFGTCADGKDNNSNGLIDAKDPVCHTDGDASNKSSYNPYLNEGGAGGSGAANGSNANGGKLPFTGADVIAILIGGLMLAAGELALRRRTEQS
jgi:hypothetical protein